jgi:hypothetical protein
MIGFKPSAVARACMSVAHAVRGYSRARPSVPALPCPSGHAPVQRAGAAACPQSPLPGNCWPAAAAPGPSPPFPPRGTALDPTALLCSPTFSHLRRPREHPTPPLPSTSIPHRRPDRRRPSPISEPAAATIHRFR